MKKEPYNASSRLISVAERLLTKRLQEGLLANSLEITVEQWRILFYLWKKDGVNQQELAIRAKKEKSTITRQVDALQKKGLIQRVYLDEDKRNKLIFLTEEGKSIEEKALNTAFLITQRAEADIDVKDLEVFKKVLQQIITNID